MNDVNGDIIKQQSILEDAGLTMVPETDETDFIPLEIPRARRNLGGYLKIGAALVAIGGASWAWQTGYRPALWAKNRNVALDFIAIDRGDVALAVVETGSIESANN